MAYIVRLFLVFIACWQVSARADETPQTLDELKAAIEKIRVESGLPGLGIALVDQHGPYWVAGLGLANLETKTPATENTLFRLGSSSKMFVALSVLKLVEEGKLSLNDKLSDLAPEIYFDNPWEKTNPIRLVNLLEHTTGWSDLSRSVFYRQGVNTSLKEALDLNPQYRKSRWIPGTRYTYNNAGPAVAAYIVQKIVGQDYEDYVQANFFNPLQMTSTTFFESDLFKAKGASLYSADGKAQPYWHIIARPSGGINSSASDMAKYMHFLIARGEFNQQHLLSEASFTRMETSTSTLGAQAGTKAGYGLHNYVTGHKQAGVVFRGHGGMLSGGHCIINYSPELKSGFVVMINQDNWQALDKIPNLIRAFLLKDRNNTKAKEIPLPEKFKNLGGYYIQISPLSNAARFNSEVLAVMRYTVSNNSLHREPLLGGWEHPSTDYAISEHVLANQWSGLPTIAIVQDPLVGEAVEVSDDLSGSLYQKVSPIRVFGVLGLIAITALLSVSSIGFACVWLVQNARRKIEKGIAISIRLWPFITSAVLVFSVFTPNIFAPSVEDTGRLSPVTITTFLCSLIYPALTAFSLINCVRYRRAQVNQVMYWHSVAVSLSQCGLAVLLAYYGFIGFRMWA